MNDNNNLNMDDLFRRAADDYPLRTDSADWDKVLGAMDEDDGSSLVLPYEQDGRRSRRRFLWLLLLLPLGGLGYYTWHGRQATHTVAVAPSSNGGYASSKTPGATVSSEKSSVSKNGTGIADPSAEKTVGSDNNPAVNRPVVGKPTGNDPVINKPAIDKPGGNTTGDNGNSGPSSIPSTGRRANVLSGGNHSSPVLAGKDYTNSGINSGSGGHRFRQNKRSSVKAKEDADSELAGTDQQTTGGQSKSSGRKQTNAKDSTYVHTARSLEYSPMTGIVPIPGIVSLNFRVNGKATPNGGAKPAVKPPAKSKNSSFYAGLMVAPDMSYVKFQSVKGVGYNIGLLFGYNFNRKLALETGISYDHKRYYTDGDYFSRKSLSLPANYYIQNVDGSCDMWEIPLNFRYNFGKGEKVKWFATTGLSTYLMTKEKYTYQYENTSTGLSWPYEASGKSNSNYLFSVFNFSIGYQQSLGKIGNLRLEPYLRVPLSGFGKGSLPIMSSGVNIGFTRRIW